MSALKITKANFEQEVMQSGKPVLLDFWASWCGPCKMVGPTVEEVSEETADQAKVGKVNVEDESELARKFRVMSIPTFILFKNGKVVKKAVGVQSKEDMMGMIQES
mgnify:CR=1 FL=1